MSCSKCSKKITGNTYKVLEHVYCRECYACSSCNQKLVGQFFPVDGQAHTYLCSKCFNCNKCSKPIGQGDGYLIVGDGIRMHNSCLSCSAPNCGKNLSSKKFWRLGNGMPACENHNGQ